MLCNTNYDLLLNEASELRYHRKMSKRYPPLSKMKAWPLLQPGDVIDVVAPASACSRAELQGAVRYLKARGYQPRVPKNIFGGRSLLLAQTDQERLNQLYRALTAADSKAVWCLRGGYGMIRLMPELASLKPARQSKIVIGYSDITTLHAFLNSVWKWPTLHGPLLDRFGRQAHRPKEERELWGLMTGSIKSIQFTGLQPINSAARKRRRLSGGLVGGNITVLTSSLGTPAQVNPRGQMVFFEDLGERPHRLDRMFSQLAQTGFFAAARAVVFGDLLVASALDRRILHREVLPRFAESLKIPVMMGLSSGHGPVQRPLPLMTKAWLTTGPKGSLIVEDGR
jgi:muramoyltetrapeptide carboxypeptidase